MYKFRDSYFQPKYQQNAKIYYMDTDSFIIRIKTEDIYEDIADHVENDFTHKNYEANLKLLTKKNEKVIKFIKDELGGKIMT